MQEWEPLGRILTEQAQCPTVLVRAECWRIYYANRIDGKSYIHAIDVEKGNPHKILKRYDNILRPGPLGSIDHFGVMPSCAVKMHNGNIHLYYVAWSVRKDVPYHNLTGLAMSRDGINFIKMGPVVAHPTLYFTGTACVVPRDSDYYMVQMSCTGWVEGDPPEPRYLLLTGQSDDGIHWRSDGVAIDYASEDEAGISSATIVSLQCQHMWYSYRKLNGYRTNPDAAYKIGYASAITTDWIRRDDVVQIPRQDWDSEMQCYPEVIKHRDHLYMFYNGNGFGQTGIGVARLKLSNDSVDDIIQP